MASFKYETILQRRDLSVTTSRLQRLQLQADRVYCDACHEQKCVVATMGYDGTFHNSVVTQKRFSSRPLPQLSCSLPLSHSKDRREELKNYWNTGKGRSFYSSKNFHGNLTKVDSHYVVTQKFVDGK